MPYRRGAKVELVSRREGGAPIPVRAQLIVGDEPRAADEGALHAHWQRFNPSTPGEPFVYLDLDGERGHVSGFTINIQGAEPGNTVFFEGDDMVWLDGEQAIFGTGSEDALNGGWYGLPGRWNDRRSFPLHGSLDYSRQLATTGAYRWLLGDAYPFEDSVRFTLEYGPQNNDAPGDYAGAVFYYLDRADGIARPPLMMQDRRVEPAKGFSFAMVPLAGLDSLMNAKIDMGGREVEGRWVQYASFARDIDMERNAAQRIDDVEFDDTWGAPLISWRVEAPRAGRYEITVDALRGPDSAILQLLENKLAAGEPRDFYAPVHQFGEPVRLGEVTLNQGVNLLFLQLPGRHRASTGSQVNLIEIKGRLLEYQ